MCRGGVIKFIHKSSFDINFNFKFICEDLPFQCLDPALLTQQCLKTPRSLTLTVTLTPLSQTCIVLITLLGTADFADSCLSGVALSQTLAAS